MIKIFDKELNINDCIDEKPGIYKIIACDEYSKRLNINRFLGSDIEGIIYIGKSNNLRKRLKKIRSGILNTDKLNTGHIATRRIKNYSNIQYFFRNHQIFVEVEYCTNDDEAKTIEKKYLEDYTNIFGERPPLNKQ